MADWLPEEKKRGMTIDLGYAYWPQPDGRVPGFIDVPDHEKFLSNMLAGVGGIDHALLVVACDDGVMEQTVSTCEGQTIKPDLDSQAIAHIERRQRA